MSSVAGRLSDRWLLGVRRQAKDLARLPSLTAGDVVAGLSVALVLIPQSLAYADLANLPPGVGLFAGAFPLLIFAVFASSPYLQTGPVALTSLLVAGALAGAGFEEGTAEQVGAAAILALIVGAIRLFLGIGRLGAIVYSMAEPVTIGFTSGAGVVILSSQLPKALGVVLPEDVAARANPIARALWAVTHPSAWLVSALIISAVALVLMLQGRKIHRLFPGVLIAVLFALIFARVTGRGGQAIPEIESGLPVWSLDLPFENIGSLLVGGIVIALVGFAEPASIARMFSNEEQSSWSSSREFFASGLANLVASVTGAYPVGGSFGRSSVNRFAGATTRLSGAVTGLLMIAFLPFAGVLDGLPEAVLGAIIVGAVFKLVKPRKLLRLWTRSPWQAGLAWLTFIATILTPPNIHFAVIIGIAATVILHFIRPFHLDVERVGEQLQIRPRGLLWIITTTRFKKALSAAVEADDGTGDVVVSLDRSTAIDSAIADAVAGGAATALRAGRGFRVENVPDGAQPILENYDLTVV